MSHRIKWTNTLVEAFIIEGCLSEEESEFLRLHARKNSAIQIAMKMNISESKVYAMNAKLKLVYDEVSKYDPIKFPPRTKTNAYKQPREE